MEKTGVNVDFPQALYQKLVERQEIIRQSTGRKVGLAKIVVDICQNWLENVSSDHQTVSNEDKTVQSLGQTVQNNSQTIQNKDLYGTKNDTERMKLDMVFEKLYEIRQQISQTQMSDTQLSAQIKKTFDEIVQKKIEAYNNLVFDYERLNMQLELKDEQIALLKQQSSLPAIPKNTPPIIVENKKTDKQWRLIMKRKNKRIGKLNQRIEKLRQKIKQLTKPEPWWKKFAPLGWSALGWWASSVLHRSSPKQVVGEATDIYNSLPDDLKAQAKQFIEQSLLTQKQAPIFKK